MGEIALGIPVNEIGTREYADHEIDGVSNHHDPALRMRIPL